MKISQALDKIDEHQLFVPTFQREYVWNRNDAKELIDSLIKEYPTGSLLIWETNKPPELKGPHKYDEKQGAVSILLDGQQRLTTLYMLTRGSIPPYYTAAEIENDIRGLYVNVETLELEYHKKTKMANDPRWRNLTDIFKKKVRAKDIVRDLEEKCEEVSRERDDRLDDHTRKIENILDRDFPVQTVPIGTTHREAIIIFYKVNSGGVALTEAELALAQISGYWPEARDIFKSKLTALAEKGFVFKLDFIVYVLLGCLHHQGADMKKLHGTENNEPLRLAWKLLDEHVLDYVVSIMRSDAYVDHTKEINTEFALIPIIVYCFDKKGEPLGDAEKRKLVKWFYYSQIKFHYSSQSPQKLDRDLRIVTESENPFDKLLAVIGEDRPLEVIPTDFVNRKVSHPLFNLVRWYLKSKGAFCLTTGVALRQAMGKKYALEYDHIFPASKLKEKGYGPDNPSKHPLSNELTNRAILTQIANRTKSAMDAKDYLAGVAKKYPNALALQCIPEDPILWEIDNYEEFLQERREMLAEALNDFLNGITETKPTEAAMTLEELIANGEDEELEFKSSLRWDSRQGAVNKKLEDVVVKTIAAFANAQGGTLLIGVNDDGEAIGLEGDYNTLGDAADRDKFQLHLGNVLDKAFGKPLVTTNVHITFPTVEEIEICRVDIKAASKPAFVPFKDTHGQPQEKFYVRRGNSSQELSMSEVQSYIFDRFA